jgi:hypothetical protein
MMDWLVNPGFGIARTQTVPAARLYGAGSPSAE